jgi:hypothetical protein
MGNWCGEPFRNKESKGARKLKTVYPIQSLHLQLPYTPASTVWLTSSTPMVTLLQDSYQCIAGYLPPKENRVKMPQVAMGFMRR